MATLRRVDIWRRSLGVCCVCGQPIASPRPARAEEEVSAAMDSDARLLTEETPIRLTLLRFNALGEYHYAHVVDAYTFLQPDARRGASALPFHKALERYWDGYLQAVPGLAQFRATVDERSAVYRTALATQHAVAERVTVPACRRCNKAMDRPQSHTLAIMRCRFPGAYPTLETPTQQALAARKVLQQVGLYFAEKADHVWTAKTERELLKDAALWRCIAHLSNWGTAPFDGSGARFRMIACFHAAHWIFLADALSEATHFETWHRVFREFFMETFLPDTFYGMTQADTARRFASGGTPAAEAWLRQRLLNVSDHFRSYHLARKSLQAALLMDRNMAFAGVIDEESLLQFLALEQRSKPPMAAVGGRFLRYFSFQLEGSNPFFVRQCQRLAQEIARTLVRRGVAQSVLLW